MYQPSQRVAIIGAGNVGSSIAYSIINQEIAREVLILDIAEELGKAQVLDMQDASNFTHGVEVKFADYTDLNDGDIVVITCGAAQKEDQTRTELLSNNARVIRDVIKKIRATAKKVYILMVTNPVDVLTYIAIKESGLPKGMVFGSGTYLDSARLRVAISKEININPINVHANIMGEHGDSSFPVLSSANVASMPLTEFLNLDEKFYDEIAQKVRNSAYEIIKGKKATYYGIGSAVAKICKAIIRNENMIIPLCYLLDGQYGESDVVMGVPVKISAAGAEFVGEVDLNSFEKEMLKKSADTIRENIKTAN